MTTERRRLHTYKGVLHPQAIEDWLQSLPGRLIAVLQTSSEDGSAPPQAVTVEDVHD